MNLVTCLWDALIVLSKPLVLIVQDQEDGLTKLKQNAAFTII